LFVGRNNCGKTSVLDAIFLLTGMSNADLIRRVNTLREYKYSDFSDLAALNFYNFDITKNINLHCDEDSTIKRDLIISPIITEDLNNLKIDSISNQPEDKIIKLEFKFSRKEGGLTNTEYVSIGDDDNNVENVESSEKKTNRKQNGINYPQFKITKPDRYKESIRCVFLNSKYSLTVENSTLSSIIENKQKDIVVNNLSRIDSKITDIAIIRNRVLIDVGLNKLIPLEVLGDGVRKLLAIIIAIYKCKDGILLIDEIDNGLHYSSMSVLWDTILYTAKEFNVQIFATTHNIDSLKALKSVLETPEYISEQENVACYRLRHADNDELVAFRYDFEELGLSIDMEHEIR
jgi:AAA15 family ATPase/GTPase